MKNKEYVEKYAPRLMGPDAKKAAVELMDDFIREYNSEVRRRHVAKAEDVRRLDGDMNRKGNELAGMLMVKCGRMVFKKDWFLNMLAVIREENDNAEVHETEFH